METQENNTKNKPKYRIFHCQQYEFNPKDGSDLHFNEENIKSCLEHKTIRRWAYVRHDKDPYTKDDKNLYGHLKNAHWHIVIDLGNSPKDVDTVAKWLNIPP